MIPNKIPFNLGLALPSSESHGKGVRYTGHLLFFKS